ncbi:MAG: AI-2E family transporter [Candidatus Aminicenantes bacterium]|nr:AI-2E family transporter [Candidatus Aminicenantes bacterium]
MKTEKSLGLGDVPTIAGLTLIVFLAGVVLRMAKPVLFPFLLAVVLSFIVSPVLDFLVRIKIPRAVAIILILILTFFVLYLLGMLIFESGKGFASEIPKYAEKLRAGLDDLLRKMHLSRAKSPSIDWLASLDVNKLGSFFLSSLGPFLSFISNLFLVLIFLVFTLAGKGQTEKKIGNAFNPAQATRLRLIIKNINYQIQHYLAIKTISNLIMGILTAGILTIFGLNYALLFGFLTFVLNYIPTIGSIIATALPMLIAAFQFSSLWPAVWIGVLMTVIQNIQGNFVEPKLVGRGLGLSPLVVLFALFFWGWLWGIAGMVLAVPIVAMVKIVCDNIPGLKFIAVLMSH